MVLFRSSPCQLNLSVMGGRAEVDPRPGNNISSLAEIFRLFQLTFSGDAPPYEVVAADSDTRGCLSRFSQLLTIPD